ncbi:RNA polymerase subunit sigma-70 [Sporosarcina sp. PTS2304]|uniref:sigma-70 family RNA polymerase sigma factor n=1 Tax=Sporosarcina sp. PTS2304 TaxID=2283194 RepID=UPI000E0CDD77|nr:sigma-70 family RNA polymerase sigma factor [Sporosarcina sp. PTS2304]AXI00782.1 RNA polymerase subunit sigma-70 [Sporosarcina sp. PTS2304]
MTTKEKFQLVESFLVENQETHYRLAYSYVRNKENALDIVQDSIVKALQSIHGLKEISFLKTWFYRILVNTAIDFIRKHKRMTVTEDAVLNTLLPHVQNEPSNTDLQNAINRLDPFEKSLIILRFFEDMKIDEVAIILNENKNTIRTKLYRTLKKLRLVVGEEYTA